MSDTPKAPPAWLLNGIGRVRKALTVANRSAVPANIALFEMAQGAWLTQALYVATKLGIADALQDGPLTADDVAQRVGADPGATYRVMRALASNGVLKLRRDGSFALTRVGHALRSDHDGSMAPMIEMVGSSEHWEHWGSLLHSVQTGGTAVEKIRGTSMFDYLETNPEYAAMFNDAMTGVSTVAIEMAVPLYDFTNRKLIVDVGGGHGALLAAVLAQAPRARGVLFDLPSVVQGAGPQLDVAGVAERCTIMGGSFFEAVPDGTPPHPGMLLDLEMLVHAGGRERTATEYADLLSRAGFRQTRVIPTAGPMSLVDAVPA